MAAMKREVDRHNSYIKRGLRKPYANYQIVYCGCGDETCCFISDNDPNRFAKRSNEPQR